MAMNAQEFCGKVLSSNKKSPVEFANIGIIGKNRGTVSDEKGKYTLNIKGILDKDTIRISKIGYKPVTMTVNQFKSLTVPDIYLSPQKYQLPEIKIIGKNKMKMYGEPVPTSKLNHVFGNSYGVLWLGQELGSLIDVKKKVLIREININIGECSFDSVQLRLNIYKANKNGKFHNILKEPIYFSFTKDEIKKVIAINVTKDSILIKNEVLISVEYYKHLGKGHLGFFAKNTPFKETFFRNSPEAPWKTSPGKLGLYLYGEVAK